MKRKLTLIFLSIVCALCLCFGLTACGGNSDDNDDSKQNTEQTGGGENDNTDETTTPVSTYTVTYNANGGAFADGSETYTQTVNSGSTLTAPTSPTKDGCTFAGWATSKNGSTMWQFGSDKVTGNTTLYASWSEQSASILSVDGASIDGTEIYMLVDRDTDSVSLSTKVVCSSDSTWKLYYDKLGQTEIPTKIAASTTGSLTNGDNVFYIVVTSTDGTQVNVYTLTIYRSYAVYITYYDGTTAIKTETAYTGYSFTTTYTPDISGYTFNYWKTSSGSKFTETTLTSALSLYADKTANDYTVTYDVNGGNELATTTKTVTYDSNYTLTIPTRTGYSFNGWYNGSTQLTGEDGKSLAVWSYADDTTITAKWTANDYTVTLNLSNNSAGTVTGDGDHAYDSSVTIKATTNGGYTFIGWYDKNGELVSADASYTFTMGFDAAYTAKFEEDYTALSNFEYTVSGSNYTITGIKDKTVTEIVVPNYVTAIEEGAFSGCSKLVSITLPFVGGSAKTSTDTYQYPFGYIFGTSSYTGGTDTWQNYYGSSTSSTTYTTYYIPTTLTTVTITGGDILYGAFNSCKSLTSVTLGDSVTSIGNSAFYSCKSLTSVTLGNSVTSIGNSAFSNCSSLESVYYNGTASQWASISFNSYDANPLNYADNLYLNGELATDITLENITTINSYAFYNYDTLISITIPDSVTSIGNRAFSGCYKLIEVYNLSSLEITTGSTDYGYAGYYALNIYTSIDEESRLLTYDDYLFMYDSDNNYYLVGYIGTEDTITLPDNIKGKSYSINQYAFYGCTAITNVTIPNGVTSIGDDAFEYCTALTNITIPDSVTSIGDRAFYHCASLASITIPDSVTTIGRLGFALCTSLISVVIPDSLTYINDNLFYNCTSLKSATIGSGVTCIEVCAFENCTSLTNVTFKNTSGWYVSTTIGATSGTNVTVTNTSTAATYLKSTYYGYYWYKK